MDSPYVPGGLTAGASFVQTGTELACPAAGNRPRTPDIASTATAPVNNRGPPGHDTRPVLIILITTLPPRVTTTRMTPDPPGKLAINGDEIPRPGAPAVAQGSHQN